MSALWVLVGAAAMVFVAGGFSAADAALSGFSRARAEELVTEGRTGARRVLQILDDAPRYLNTVLMLRLLFETGAIVLVTLTVSDLLGGRWWPTVATSLGVMLLVSFVVVGVAPRTMGRQHRVAVGLALAGPVVAVTRILGPVPQLLILLGNAITPGRGFRRGPFSTETELRELVDLAEASAVIEEGERKMIHSVFQLGDTIVREVMVPRPDIVYLERHKNLRQAMSLFLRSGYSRVPVIDENLDDVVGMAYLKDIVRRDFEDPEVETTQRIDELMRPVHYVPDSKPADQLLAEMQASRQHIAVVVDEYGGTAGLVTIEDVLEEIVGEITDEYDEAEAGIETTDAGTRVSSRFPVSDLGEVFGVHVVDDDVDTVGGLMAKYLGKVPIPGSAVEVHGLRFEAEGPSGRRNKVGTVLVNRVGEWLDQDQDESADRAGTQERVDG
ncbi:hemolysin family protein [Nocardioides campestrisoli]|uniref:hemolysin family protein n=2 Tax=Nocardioides campestrisoli TaxID=2736757 RepID=UPI001CD5DFB3|nr:hemolysin family protein [Nocardioides campestrisoli]